MSSFDFDGCIYSRDGVNFYEIKQCKKLYILSKIDDDYNIDKRFRTKRKSKYFLLQNLEFVFKDIQDMKKEYNYKWFLKQKGDELKTYYYNNLIENNENDDDYYKTMKTILNNNVHYGILTTI
jgi:hypothetical protein